MKLASILSLIIGLLVFCSSASFAGAPMMLVKFKNTKLDSTEQKAISEQWKSFIADKRDVLLKPGKDYTVDQFCSFSIELSEKPQDEVPVSIGSPEDGKNLELTEGYLEKPNYEKKVSWWRRAFEAIDPQTRRARKREVNQAIAKPVDVTSIKLLKHEQNYEYNLAAIEFLKSSELRMLKKDESKPIIVEFIYLSYY